MSSKRTSHGSENAGLDLKKIIKNEYKNQKLEPST